MEPGFLKILPAPELCKLEGNDLQEEQCVWNLPQYLHAEMGQAELGPNPTADTQGALRRLRKTRAHYILYIVPLLWVR